MGGRKTLALKKSAARKDWDTQSAQGSKASLEDCAEEEQGEEMGMVENNWARLKKKKSIKNL